ncbi:TetR family transcriptional regulator [uncultured Abyssibacter sp.]|uniref:TetR family transcriptional regulator n=1 Tax=uncultured Abyssibacter sp. TaxID=2320202 RepID=UPI0032B29C37
MSTRSSKSRRIARRGDTRQILIDKALAMLDGDKSFDGLSLRELTREVGIVPTGFYRHFPDMDALGLALVDEAFRALRKILEDVREDTRSTDRLVTSVVKSLVRHIRANRAGFAFIASERFGGSAVVRNAIRRELRLVQTELAVDLARLPYLKEWNTADLHMIASLLLNAMVANAIDILDVDTHDREGEAALMKRAEQHLRLILLGVPQWKTDH